MAAEIRQNHPFYRLLFSSLTTYVTLLEDRTFIRFTQQFSQKRKSENAVSLFLLEEGLFEKRVYEAISYLMDGAVEFRMGSTRNFLSVMGLGQAEPEVNHVLPSLIQHTRMPRKIAAGLRLPPS